MKRIAIITALAVCSFGLGAQTLHSTFPVDTLSVRQMETEDVTLSGRSIFSVLSDTGSKVTLHQDQSIASAMSSHVSANREKTIQGYRVRIFFENKQNSRGESEETLKRFREGFPGVPAYRSFSNPFFKVTVGDFRTKSEATKLLNSLKGFFPNAFVVKEAIHYPSVDQF